MAVLAGALLIAAAVIWAALRLSASTQPPVDAGAPDRILALLTMFQPIATAADGDPRALVGWSPLVRTARALFAEEFSALDRAHGAPFPFGSEAVQAAHARWTTEWLAWERAHDAEYKRRAAETQADVTVPESLQLSRLDAIEREKLDLYQRRYEEYVRVSRALQKLLSNP